MLQASCTCSIALDDVQVSESLRFRTLCMMVTRSTENTLDEKQKSLQVYVCLFYSHTSSQSVTSSSWHSPTWPIDQNHGLYGFCKSSKQTARPKWVLRALSSDLRPISERDARACQGTKHLDMLHAIGMKTHDKKGKHLQPEATRLSHQLPAPCKQVVNWNFWVSREQWQDLKPPSWEISQNPSGRPPRHLVESGLHLRLNPKQHQRICQRTQKDIPPHRPWELELDRVLRGQQLVLQCKHVCLP